MPRVFSAVKIEDEETLNRLEEIRNQIDHGFQPVPREKMHITLQFFKNINEEELGEIKKTLHSVDIESFNAKIKGLGAFPSKSYIRVLWAGVEAEEIFDLKQQVSDHSVEASNNHDFKPHVTLHRVENLGRESKKSVHKLIDKYSKDEISSFQVRKVKLFKSHLDSNGSRYEELAVEDLG